MSRNPPSHTYTTLRLLMGCIPVTSKLPRTGENSGKTSADELVFTMVRQPRTRPVEASLAGVQATAPTYKRLLLAICIFRCLPFVIPSGAEAVSELVFTVCRAPLAGQPAGGVGGVPATNRLEPFNRPTVAPQTGTTVPKFGAAPLKSTDTTLAWVPPHSAPQFKTNAWVSVLPNTAVKG